MTVNCVLCPFENVSVLWWGVTGDGCNIVHTVSIVSQLYWWWLQHSAYGLYRVPVAVFGLIRKFASVCILLHLRWAWGTKNPFQQQVITKPKKKGGGCVLWDEENEGWGKIRCMSRLFCSRRSCCFPTVTSFHSNPFPPKPWILE